MSEADGCREGLQIAARVRRQRGRSGSSSCSRRQRIESSNSACLALACRLYPYAANPNTPPGISVGTINKEGTVQAKKACLGERQRVREKEHQLTWLTGALPSSRASRLRPSLATPTGHYDVHAPQRPSQEQVDPPRKGI